MNKLLLRDTGWVGIVLAGLLAWGLVLLSDYLIWDTIHAAHCARDPAHWYIEARLYSDTGNPLSGIVTHWLAVFSAPELASKCLSVALWVASAVLFRSFLMRGFGLTKEDSTWIASVAVALPFYDLLGELCLFTYTLFAFLFWLAWVCFFSCRLEWSWRGIVLRLGTLTLFVLCFQLGSNLPYFYGILSVYMLRDALVKDQLFGFRPWLTRLRAHADFLIVPILYWSWKTKYGGPQGWYYKMIDYNAPKFELTQMLAGYASLLQMLRVELLDSLGTTWRVGVALLVAVFFWFVNWRRDSGHKEQCAPRMFLLGFGAAIFLILCAGFAYVTVAKGFSAYGWNTRNGILLNFPVALALGCLIAWLQSLLPKGYGSFQGIALSFILGLSVVSSNISILKLQGLWAKQISAVPKLKEVISESGAIAISLRDQLLSNSTMEKYPTLIWTYLLTEPGELPKTLIVDTQPMVADQLSVSPTGQQQATIPLLQFDPPTMQRLIELTSLDYALTGIPRTGRTVTCVLQDKSEDSDGWLTGWRYLRGKYFSPAEMPAFLKGLTRVLVFDGVSSPREK